jgi:hypothetical protein
MRCSFRSGRRRTPPRRPLGPPAASSPTWGARFRRRSGAHQRRSGGTGTGTRARQAQGIPRDDHAAHNLPLTMIGTGIRWFGWCGFNAGPRWPPTAWRRRRSNTILSPRPRHARLAGDRTHPCGHATTPAGSGAVAGLVAITPCAGSSARDGAGLHRPATASSAIGPWDQEAIQVRRQLDVVAVHPSAVCSAWFRLFVYPAVNEVTNPGLYHHRRQCRLRSISGRRRRHPVHLFGMNSSSPGVDDDGIRGRPRSKRSASTKRSTPNRLRRADATHGVRAGPLDSDYACRARSLFPGTTAPARRQAAHSSNCRSQDGLVDAGVEIAQPETRGRSSSCSRSARRRRFVPRDRRRRRGTGITPRTE